MIQVTGRYFHGFEISSFEIELPVESPVRNSKFYDLSNPIWLEVKQTKHLQPYDSLGHYYIVVSGIFDTSMHGHLGNYVATIRDAIIESK